MTKMPRLSAQIILFIPLIVLCSCGRIATSRSGLYHAEIHLSEGVIPMQLRIDEQNSDMALWVVEGDRQARAELVLHDNNLVATLPNDLGVLRAQFDGKRLTGTLQLPDPSLTAFQVVAMPDAGYRFFKEIKSDNADVSGTWRMQLGTFSELALLEQIHDTVDGHMQIGKQQCDLMGQMQGDDINLAIFCKNELWLLKGSVNKRGDLEGRAWRNHDAAVNWHAKHSDEPVASQEDTSRKVSLPWAVPTR